jgi:hypothetical protein
LKSGSGEVLRDQGEKIWATSDLVLAVSEETGLVLFTIQVAGHDATALKQSMAIST